MESRKKCPQKRKSIHNMMTKNTIKPKSLSNRFQNSTSDSENFSFKDDDDDDLSLDEEFIDDNQTYVETGPRKRQRERRAVAATVSRKKTFSLGKTETNNCKHVWWRYLLFVVVLFVIFAFTKGCFNITIFTIDKNMIESNSKNSILHNVKKTLMNLKSKYKNQDESLWNSAYYGIRELIERPHKLSIILLLGKNSDPLDCLSILLGNVSSNALNSSRLTISPNEFDNDMGSVIEKLRVKLRNNKAVIIWDLLNINVEALKAFHNLCDRINPLVEEVIYIITIIADNFNHKDNPLKFVEKELFKKLNGKMKNDAIEPLITRITDGPIYLIKPEPSITHCPLPKISRK